MTGILDGEAFSVADRSCKQELRPKQNENVALHEFSRRTSFAGEENRVLDETYFV